MITHELDLARRGDRPWLYHGLDHIALDSVQHGVERPYGLDLPEGLVKTKSCRRRSLHRRPRRKRVSDERLTCDEVVEGLVEPEPSRVREVALECSVADKRWLKAGLILVDTKYEFGMINGKLCLITKYTPDSSRYWVGESYEACMAAGDAPKQFDKEHLRLWLGRQGYRGDGPSPELSDDIVAEVSARYISAYELTDRTFSGQKPASADRVAKNVSYFGS